ncbi:MAG: InlB B-repeat-containing protein, partial [Acutalibacteraceae bacterium]
EKGTIKNVGLSEAYLLGSLELEQEVIGGIVGMVVDWDNDIEMPTHSRSETERITKDPAYAERIPVIENCFVDHTCYLQGKTVGGIIATTGGTFTMDNCIFTGSLKGGARDSTSGLIGSDWGFGSRIYHCVSIPLTCDRPAGGSSNSDWRSTLEHWCTLAYKTYYFSLYRMYNTYFEKIANPKLFAGENAKTTMEGLDWEEEIGDGGTWRTVEGGTPVLTVFAKHRTAEELEKFSCIGFPAPSTTLSFSTGTSEVVVDDIVAPMYSKITLPTPTREGYEFKGWHTFSDLTYLYPYDYQPPRNLVLYAEWEPKGIMQNFENYPNTMWDCDDKVWELNKPGIKSGYKSEYVHKGGKSMHLLGTSSENTDLLLNYEDMLTEGQSYTMTFWLTTDNASNPATLLSLVHNSKPVYLDTEVASEPMAVATGLKVGEWVQYSYSFTAKTKWVSLRATGNSSLYFDDIMITPISGVVNLNNGIQTTGGNGAGANGLTSPNTSDSTVTVVALVSAIMICAVIAVISRKNLVEVIED